MRTIPIFSAYALLSVAILAIGCDCPDCPTCPPPDCLTCPPPDCSKCPSEGPVVEDDTLRKIQGIIAEQLEVAEGEVKPEKSLVDDLGADSLALVELVLALEEEFGVKIPDDKCDELKTVGDVVNYIKSKRPT
jgi:acyl carrier protein